jgi:hypothetical protein
MLVLVVAKKVRDELRVSSGQALRAGLAMAGAEALFLLAALAARLKPCPDTKPDLELLQPVYCAVPPDHSGQASPDELVTCLPSPVPRTWGPGRENRTTCRLLINQAS